LYRERRSWLWGLILVASLVFATVWIVRFRPDHAIIGAPDPRTTAEQIDSSLSYIPRRAGQLVGSLGWLDVPLPGFLVSIWLAVGAFVGVIAVVLGSWRRRLALIILTAGVIFGPTVAEIPSASEYGLIWQGRYTLPIAMGLPVLAMWTLHERRLDRARVVRGLGVIIVAATSAANLLAVAVALTDRQTGRSWPLDVELGPQNWSADVRGWVVLTVAGGGLAVLGVLLGVLAWQRRELPDRPPPARDVDVERPIDPSLTGAEPAVC